MKKILTFINNFFKGIANFIIKLMIIVIFILCVWILFDILYLIEMERECSTDLSKRCLQYAQNRRIMGYN